MLHGDFGTSILTGRSISAQVGERASVTFPLIVLGLLIAMGLGIPLGCEATLARSRAARGMFHMVAIIGGAVPALWGGLLLILLFSRGTGLIGVFPSQGFPQGGWSDFGSALMSLVLQPARWASSWGPLMRYTRSALGGLASSGYIDMAMSCGMTHRQAVLCVGLRLAMPQLVSVIGLTFAEMVTGVMVIENLFALPGIGNGLVTDVATVISSPCRASCSCWRLFPADRLLVDLLHRVLDPRLKSADDVTEVNA